MGRGGGGKTGEFHPPAGSRGGDYNHVDVKRQNHLRVGADKPKLKVKMQSASDGDVLLENPHFELAAKDVFRLGRCYILPGRSRSLGQQPGKHGYRRSQELLSQ